MKTFLFLFILSASSLFAGVRQVIVERVPALGETPLYFKVTAWGLLENGVPKSFELKSDSQIKKCKDFENCEMFGFNREAIRCVIIWDGDEVRSVAFGMEEKFEINQWSGEELDTQAAITVQALKTYLEAQ